MTIALVKAIAEKVGRLDYVPYNIKDTKIMVGVPSVPIVGLEYIFAKHFQWRTKMRMSLTGRGIFTSNRSSSGMIEVAVLSESASSAAMQTYGLTGVNIPISATDIKTAGTSFFIASNCRLVNTPEWRRAASPGLAIFTFHTPRLLISNGLRLTE